MALPSLSSMMIGRERGANSRILNALAKEGESQLMPEEDEECER